MRKLVACFTLLATAAFAADSIGTLTPLRGYTAEHSAAEMQWEQKFRALPDANVVKENLRRLSARPHHVGSPYDKDNAEWLVAQMKSFGLDAKVEQFETLFPTPKSRHLELLGTTKFIAKLEEPTIAIDPTSSQHAEQLPTYNAFSKDGDVTAPLVYVNYGAPADYEELARMGVSVKGAIVIARYGQTWRGIKPKVAAEHGAVGCLIYSDPADDGYARGDIYPNGPMRPPDGVQRGSVMDMPVYPGDPQSPGFGATQGGKGGTLIPLEDVKTITKIPVMPISYADATPFLKALGGQVVPMTWRGALPFTYHVGPSKVMAHFAIHFNWDRKPLYDAVATIPGSTMPDQWVIRGNHHDGWVNGAADPLSGASAELEEAHALGTLLKQGWKPQRTIIYCFWDGEEPGLLGSTEWAEFHAEELKQHAVAYINSDGNGRGFFRAEGSHSLENFIGSVTKDVDDPETKLSVWKRGRLAEEARPAGAGRGGGGGEEGGAAGSEKRADTRIGALGSGSDYTVFIDHLGVPSANIGFGGEDQGGGQYHSIYDDFYYYSHFGDTTFAYGKALAQTGGSIMIRLADADVIPYQFTDQAETIHGYVTEVKRLAETLKTQITRQNKAIEDGAYAAAADPTKTSVPPAVQTVPPAFSFGPLDKASADLTAAAAAFDKALDAKGGVAPAAVNVELLKSEHALTDPQGLPNRPWFQNMVYAPGFYTGYGVKTLPAVRETMEQKEWPMVDPEIVRTAAAIEREVDVLKAATKLLGGS